MRNIYKKVKNYFVSIIEEYRRHKALMLELEELIDPELLHRFETTAELTEEAAVENLIKIRNSLLQ